MNLSSAEDRKHTGIVLIDLKKSFFTLDYKILLDKIR